MSSAGGKRDLTSGGGYLRLLVAQAGAEGDANEAEDHKDHGEALPDALTDLVFVTARRTRVEKKSGNRENKERHTQADEVFSRWRDASFGRRGTHGARLCRTAKVVERKHCRAQTAGEP